MSTAFKVGITRDFLKADGTIGWGDIGLQRLDDAPNLEWEFLPERTRVLSADHLRGYDALALLGPRVTAETLDGLDRLALIARFGVGFDNIDIDACTAHGVVVTNAPDGVRRPMASATMTMILALSHRLFDKDRLTRSADGWQRKLDFMGYGLTGKTLGFIGLGNIGQEVARLTAPFGVRRIASDPYLDPAKAAAVNTDLVDLDTLLREADFVITLCQLTPETRHLLNAERLALMKPTAFLISMARGPIVDQQALANALRSGQIRGAAMDVFEQEPIDPNDPILALDNVIVTPHALCWTDEMARSVGGSVIDSILAVASGNTPKFMVNPHVVNQPAFQHKLIGYRERMNG
jgi:D-3-phosphoglycerate dehydrogenase